MKGRASIGVSLSAYRFRNLEAYHEIADRSDLPLLIANEGSPRAGRSLGCQSEARRGVIEKGGAVRSLGSGDRSGRCRWATSPSGLTELERVGAAGGGKPSIALVEQTKRLIAVLAVASVTALAGPNSGASAEPSTDTDGCQVVADKYLNESAPGHQGVQNAGSKARGEGPCGFGTPGEQA